MDVLPIPTLDLWDTVTEVLRSTNDAVQPNHNGIRESGARPRYKAKCTNDKRKTNVDQLSNVDYVPSVVHLSTVKLSSK